MALLVSKKTMLLTHPESRLFVQETQYISTPLWWIFFSVNLLKIVIKIINLHKISTIPADIPYAQTI